MTAQSTWIPHDPPMKVGDQARILCDWHPNNGQVGTITAILDHTQSRWCRTDRWRSDWYVLHIDGADPERLGFLEDELQPC